MRNIQLNQIKNQSTWDVIIIGGGASGLGVAVDCASRGYRTLLLEAHDLPKARPVVAQNCCMVAYVIWRKAILLW